MAPYKKSLKTSGLISSFSTRAAFVSSRPSNEPGLREVRRRSCTALDTGPRSRPVRRSQSRRSATACLSIPDSIRTRTSAPWKRPVFCASSRSACMDRSSSFGTTGTNTRARPSAGSWRRIRTGSFIASQDTRPSSTRMNSSGLSSNEPLPIAHQGTTMSSSACSTGHSCACDNPKSCSGPAFMLRNCHGQDCYGRA